MAGNAMAGEMGNGGDRRMSRGRIAAWIAAALVLLVPLVAMQFTDEVAWSVGDFVFAGVLLFGVGITYELTARKTGDTAYRAAVAIALAAAFILVGIGASVGIIGSANNPANMMCSGVLAVGIIGAVVVRFQPDGMARVLFATAIAQALVGVISVFGGLGYPRSGPGEILIITEFFVALFAGSALLFRESARGQAERSAT